MFWEFVLDKSSSDRTECCRKVATGRKVLGVIRSLLNARSLKLECSRVLQEGLFMVILMYGSETAVEREGKI